MCGLFGTIRPQQYDHRQRSRAAAALIDLGRLAEERGTDSAGIATLHSRTLTTRQATHPEIREQVSDRWRFITTLGAFSDRLPRHPRLRSELETASVILGHTRLTTQGATTLDNASPMDAGDIVGTHNGDVTAPTRNGSTDSAWLFDQLGHAPTIKATTSVLTSLRGRAALAWARHSRPDLVFLARTALSPLATATDRAGALWWASNPQWLRELNDSHDLQLSKPVQMLEGTFIVLRSDLNEVTQAADRRFIATSRPHDERIAHSAAWRGFTLTDRRHELDNSNHQVQSAYLGGVYTRSQRLS